MPTGDGYWQAVFLDFEDFTRLKNATQDLLVFVTVRSPAAHIVSMAETRMSTRGSVDKSLLQYQEAYRHLFRFFGSEVPFFLVPFVSLLLDGKDAVNGLFALMGMKEFNVEMGAKQLVNKKRYQQLKKLVKVIENEK